MTSEDGETVLRTLASIRPADALSYLKAQDRQALGLPGEHGHHAKPSSTPGEAPRSDV